jgi:hypothetical protein
VTFPYLKLIKNERNNERLAEYLSRKRQTTAILVPFLNRENNLVDFLFNLHSYLQRKFINYLIVVVEQANSNDDFNKGRLYNAAYSYLASTSFNLSINCVILHDVDLLPESDFNLYECDQVTDFPRHLSVSIREGDDNQNEDEFKLDDKFYKIQYDFLIGGVVCIRPRIFELLNGFSNEFFKWGGEDDG